jgi:two-component system, NarL family, response regulator LiaR
MPPVRVAVLNDYPVIVAGLVALLAPYGERVRVVERAVGQRLDEGTGEAVDVVLYDTFGSTHRIGDPVWQELVEAPARLAVYSWNVEPAAVRAALEGGADGYVSKALDHEGLVDHLEAVHEGRTVLPAGGRGRPARTSGWPGAEHGLSLREAEMIAQIVRGRTNQEIAEASFLSPNTVKTYIRSAYKKMDVTTRPKAILWGLAHGFETQDG